MRPASSAASIWTPWNSARLLETDATQFDASTASSTNPINVFDFSPAGTFLVDGTQTPPIDPALFGTLNGQVDNTVATLQAFDANGFTATAAGEVSLGFGGVITFTLTSPVIVSGPLYLYIGEAGDNGEVAASNIQITGLSARRSPAWP